MKTASTQTTTPDGRYSVKSFLPMNEEIYYSVLVRSGYVSVGVSTKNLRSKRDEVGGTVNSWCIEFTGNFGDSGHWVSNLATSFSGSVSTGVTIGVMIRKNRKGITFWKDGIIQNYVCHRAVLDNNDENLFLTVTMYYANSKVTIQPLLFSNQRIEEANSLKTTFLY